MAYKELQYNPIDFSKWFVNKIDRDAGDTISPLKLQKLLYYAQAWSIALLKTSLFEEDFEAWTHGPVLPSVYQYFKDNNYSNIEICELDFEIKDEKVMKLMDDVISIYGEHSAKHLENLTHTEMPWIIARGELSLEERCNVKISKDDMFEFYNELYNKLQLENGNTP